MHKQQQKKTGVKMKISKEDLRFRNPKLKQDNQTPPKKKKSLWSYVRFKINFLNIRF